MMAFCFKRKESVAKATRRLGRDRMEHALECLKECDRIGAIHCARKDIKKTRAVLRLVRTEIQKGRRRRMTNLLKEAARHLAAPRDAYVRARTLKNLAQHFKGQLAPGALRHVRAELRNDSDKEMRRFVKKKSVRRVARVLRGVAKKSDGLKVSGKGWKALAPGVKRAYGDGQQAYRTALKDPVPENFHQWRKGAKDLWYQVTLLQPLWPEQMEATAHELEQLGECLGDDHDLALLQQAVEEKYAGDGNTRELATLKGLIDERQRELRASALALGSRFYAEKPSAFCNRLAGYWRIWRREKRLGIEAGEPAS
jgi:CHAD domain-containing protein